MPTKNDSESMWLEYIMKLNDRELNRRRASGITLWTLFGLLGVLFYKISDALPTVFSQNNTFLVLIIITNFFNIAFLFSHIFVILYVNIIESEGRRLTSKLSQKSNIILVWTITLLKILGGVSNIYIGIKAPSINIETWPYYSFGIYLILDVFFPWGKYLYLQIKYRKKFIEYPEVPQAIFIEPLGKKYVSISLSLVCIGLLYVIVYSVRSLIINQHIIQNINLIKASFEITVIWIILLLFSYKLGIRIKHNWLENLERKILVEELKSDQYGLYSLRNIWDTPC